MSESLQVFINGDAVMEKSYNKFLNAGALVVEYLMAENIEFDGNTVEADFDIINAANKGQADAPVIPLTSNFPGPGMYLIRDKRTAEQIHAQRATADAEFTVRATGNIKQAELTAVVLENIVREAAKLAPEGITIEIID